MIDKNNLCILLFADSRRLKQVIQRIIEFNNLNIEYLIICLDNIIYNSIDTNNKILYPLAFNNTYQDKSKLWIFRINFIHSYLCSYNKDIIHCDADAEWIKDPTALIDNNSSIAFTPGLCMPPRTCRRYGFVVRGGFYYIQNNTFSRNFMKDWLRYTISYKDDQVGLNYLLEDKHIFWSFDDKPLVFNFFHPQFNSSFDIKYSNTNIIAKLDNHFIHVLPYKHFPRTILPNLSVEDIYVKDLIWQKV